MSVNPYEAPPAGGSKFSPRPLATPAIALMALAAFTIVLLLVSSAFNIWLLSTDLPERMRQPGGMSKRATIQVRMAWSAAMMVTNAVILYGAISMLKLRRFAAAKTAAILAVIPCCGPCFVVGLPFGIWALMVMHQPHVRRQFVSE